MRQYASKFLIVAIVLFTIASGEATATLVPVEFDITSIGGGGFGTNTATATGTSNGIGWKIETPTYISSLTSPFDGLLDQTQTVFDTLTPSIMNPMVYDNLHASRRDFTIIFDVPIAKILFYIGENNPGPSFAPGLNFGITPDFLFGDVDITGTLFGPGSMLGGTVELVPLIPTTTFVHTAFGPDFDDDIHIAFFVEPVPEPSTLVLLAIGFAGIVIYTRYREQMNGKGKASTAKGS